MDWNKYQWKDAHQMNDLGSSSNQNNEETMQGFEIARLPAV
jgi:hypothetical protein